MFGNTIGEPVRSIRGSLLFVTLCPFPARSFSERFTSCRAAAQSSACIYAVAFIIVRACVPRIRYGSSFFSRINSDNSYCALPVIRNASASES